MFLIGAILVNYSVTGKYEPTELHLLRLFADLWYNTYVVRQIQFEVDMLGNSPTPNRSNGFWA